MLSQDEENDKASLVELLLSHGADPNQATDIGDTALHFIAEQVQGACMGGSSWN